MGGLDVKRALRVGEASFVYWSLEAAEVRGLVQASRLPACMRVLLENVLRNGDPSAVGDLAGFASWLEQGTSEREISFYPARVLAPDSSGVPLLADLASIRDAVEARGGRSSKVNPLIPVDMVIDHAGAVDAAGRKDAYDINIRLEFERNRERYAFLKWAQSSFSNLRVVPPGKGIVHQVNLEYLARIVSTEQRDGEHVAFPDTLVGMDSHTPMINCLGVVGWGVGGIEAAAAMLGQPISLTIPDVVGCRLTGRLSSGVTGTDIVLTLTQRLRQAGVVGSFIEFFGDGLDALPLAHRATIANMTPEMGATVSFFPIDTETLRYLEQTGRSPAQLALTEAYSKAQGLWRTADAASKVFTKLLDFDLSSVEPSVAGPRRPQDRVSLKRVPECFRSSYVDPDACVFAADRQEPKAPVRQGDIVIAAITSCTNTSNPHAMVGAGLIARNLQVRGVRAKSWVKTSLSPGSRVVMEYLSAAGLDKALEVFGFHLVGYGCMTCGGASGRLLDDVEREIEKRDLVVAAVLSGNRNFEGRIHPLVRASFLASPALVVAYSVAGSVLVDITTEALGIGADGKPVYLRDVWPSDEEIQSVIDTVVTPDLFTKAYADVFAGDGLWERLPRSTAASFGWDEQSTYIKRPPFLDLPALSVNEIRDARPLLMLGDGITTDHISPVAEITPDTTAGEYLMSQGVTPALLNSLLSRRANHEVMVRGTFENKRLRNELANGLEGGFTRMLPGNIITSIFEAATMYAREHVPLVIIAGAEYGTGSSRDWAAKGTRLLGVRAILAESFERIHRSNLAAMGVLPLQFPSGTTRNTLRLTGEETFTIAGWDGDLTPRMFVPCTITYGDGTRRVVKLLCRLDIPREIEWYRRGGILPYVLERLMLSS